MNPTTPKSYTANTKSEKGKTRDSTNLPPSHRIVFSHGFISCILPLIKMVPQKAETERVSNV